MSGPPVISRCSRHPARYEFRAAPGRASIVREDQDIETRTEIAVDPDADIEWRRYTLTNLSARPRRIEITSCLEVVLNTAAADAGHPAFSKLFVQTEYLPRVGGLAGAAASAEPGGATPVHGDGAVRWRHGRGRRRMGNR